MIQFLLILLIILSGYFIYSSFKKEPDLNRNHNLNNYQDKNNFSEHEFFASLNQLKNQYGGYLYQNVIIKNDETSSSEIDLLYLSPWGIIVLEVKDYHGYINIDKHQTYWNVNYGHKSYQMYNPFLQNEGHIKALKHALGENYYLNLVGFTRHVDASMNIVDIVLPESICARITKENKILSQEELAYLNLQLQNYLNDHQISLNQHINNIKRQNF